MRFNRWSASCLLVIIGLLLAACATPAPVATPPTSAPAPAPKKEPVPTSAPAAATPVPAAPTATPAAATPVAPASSAPVKVGSLGTTLDAPFYIGIARGYFKEQGLAVDLVAFDSGTRQIAPLGTGELEVGRGALGVGLYNAILRGVDLRIVADSRTSHTTPTRDSAAFVIRKDLADQIKSEKDLKGRRIAVGGNVGSAFDVELSMVLRKGGLTEKDVELVPMPFPDAVLALANKSVDAAHALAEPFVTQAIEKDAAVYWKGLSEIYPNHTASVLLYSPRFIANRREDASKFMIAYVKGLRAFFDAFFNNKDKKEIIDILAKSTSVKDPALYEKMGLSPLNPDGYVNSKSIGDDAKFFLDRGLVTGPIDAAKLVDHSFVDYAISKIGKYQKP